MKQVIFLLLVATLSACGSLPKQGAAQAQYDFGITATAPSTIEFRIGSVESPSGLSSNDMRYRLAYQNPTQLFAYTESRWVAAPAELVTRRLQQRWLSNGNKPCSLQITLETFDQVFDTAASSRAVVQLRTSLQNKGKLNTTLINVEQASISADAAGGAAALIKATDEALGKTVEWANAQECR
jgi:uncharacterized lipoprotein YmbA